MSLLCHFAAKIDVQDAAHDEIAVQLSEIAVPGHRPVLSSRSCSGYSISVPLIPCLLLWEPIGMPCEGENGIECDASLLNAF